jgi:hypothetical protein
MLRNDAETLMRRREPMKPKQDPTDPAVIVRTLSPGMKKELLLLFEDSQQRMAGDDNIYRYCNDRRSSLGLERRKLVTLRQNYTFESTRQAITPLGIQVAELLKTRNGEQKGTA